ncbi:single-stranded DNA-binding protein 3-like [Ammospiza nelsoni]|uniref:single-stranded DNA-binding protein 3-like n=1 Tax=Ammospiza nelsoni TaxID=2857394 RepID=UPI00286B338C|nr:single-stranded DNA-binding protein 3-like [Ammospiza nelsoni]
MSRPEAAQGSSGTLGRVPRVTAKERGQTLCPPGGGGGGESKLLETRKLPRRGARAAARGSPPARPPALPSLLPARPDKVPACAALPRAAAGARRRRGSRRARAFHVPPVPWRPKATSQNTQPGHPNMGGQMQRMTPPRGTVPLGPQSDPWLCRTMEVP